MYVIGLNSIQDGRHYYKYIFVNLPELPYLKSEYAQILYAITCLGAVEHILGFVLVYIIINVLD